MPLFIPNTFLAANPIVANSVEQNNEAIKQYLNGGMLNTSISPAAIIKRQHVMNGEYLPTNIDYDMTSGHEIGAQELPSMLVGGLPKHWARTIRPAQTIPRTGTTFYMKEAGFILVRFVASVKGYESETVAPFAPAKANIFIGLDNVYYESTKFGFEEESDWGASFVGGKIPSWEKRRSYNGHYRWSNVSKGEHTISLFGNSDSQAFFIKALSFTIEVHYQPS